MEEHNDNRLTDEFLESLYGIKPAEPGAFFYTKLKGKMQGHYQGGHFFSKPAWVIGMLLFFLTINTWMIIQAGNTKQQTAEKKSPAQVFAETYNLNSDSNY